MVPFFWFLLSKAENFWQTFVDVWNLLQWRFSDFLGGVVGHWGKKIIQTWMSEEVSKWVVIYLYMVYIGYIGVIGDLLAFY